MDWDTIKALLEQGCTVELRSCFDFDLMSKLAATAKSSGGRLSIPMSFDGELLTKLARIGGKTLTLRSE